MKRRSLLLAISCATLSGCLSSPGQLVKTDVDRVADLHRREVFASLSRLADKLYRRNPREWKKGGHLSREAALAKLMDRERLGQSPEPEGRRGTALLLAGLREDYPHDRVAAFIGGLNTMLFDAFDGKTEFFILDELDAQRLYNAARNVEIAAWKLAQARRSQPEGELPAGTPLLLSNEMGPIQNLSFEREFGRLIGSLDILAQIVADKTNRTVVKVVHSFATAVFLPVK
ncbi:hypothetical protein [Sulfuricystis multivorans]|uniref:hypothetical protein n=1 Tax=Sulfuricystis multivorans TaxID=2211108 RepID=UPI0024DFC6DA|nr:hypothetical protein [Sulfuricystis multivorans]